MEKYGIDAPADYVQLAALALPKGLWTLVGGMRQADNARMVRKNRPYKKPLRFFFCTFVVSVAASVVAMLKFISRVSRDVPADDTAGVFGIVAAVGFIGALVSLICLIVLGAQRISQGRAAKKALQPDSTPAWYPDATARHEVRYWDSHGWTSHVADSGIVDVDLLDHSTQN